jgi:3D (Asp-Asp-Asp) domain-containing protein
LEDRIFLRITFLGGTLLLLQACGSTRSLPQYERPLARTDFQTVRTTAYTDTESDHVQYGKQNALGGTLHAALPPMRSAAVVPRALPADDADDYQAVAYRRGPQPFSMSADSGAPAGTFSSVACGSAAADWSRWPAGTIFRVMSTGQTYRVEDYGWALAGRNTIDLYMATPNDMNAWGVRSEPIQVLSWGDSERSLRLLQRHQDYRHIKRMVLELQGRERAAAAMR